MSKAAVMRQLKDALMIDEFWEVLRDDAAYISAYKMVMLDEYARFIKGRDINEVPPVERWRKALELSDRYDIPFCRDFLPFIDGDVCEGLGMSRAELKDITIDFDIWRML